MKLLKPWKARLLLEMPMGGVNASWLALTYLS
jgi:hypothetical protein